MGHSRFDVILEQDVPNLGKSGELVRVRAGFARNYLIPQKFAVPATARNRAQIEHQQQAVIARAAKLRTSAEALRQRLAEVHLTIPAAVGDENRLYGAVTTRDIAAALEARGVAISHKDLRLQETIKRIGSYDVTARVGPAMTATFQVEVVPKQ